MMTSFISLLENCFKGISKEGGQGSIEDPFEDGEEELIVRSLQRGRRH
jgi:hypothetical protein